jgi:hypothetical protein
LTKAIWPREFKSPSFDIAIPEQTIAKILSEYFKSLGYDVWIDRTNLVGADVVVMKDWPQQREAGLCYWSDYIQNGSS